MERHEAGHLYQDLRGFVGDVGMKVGGGVAHQRVYVEFVGSMGVVVD
jgi:hypothetical protein